MPFVATARTLHALDACDQGLMAAVEQYADKDLLASIRFWRDEGASERVLFLLCKQALLNTPRLAPLMLLRNHDLIDLATKRPSLVALAERLQTSDFCDADVTSIITRAKTMTDAQHAPHAASDRMLGDLLKQTRNRDDRKNSRRQK